MQALYHCGHSGERLASARDCGISLLVLSTSVGGFVGGWAGGSSVVCNALRSVLNPFAGLSHTALAFPVFSSGSGRGRRYIDSQVLTGRLGRSGLRGSGLCCCCCGGSWSGTRSGSGGSGSGGRSSSTSVGSAAGIQSSSESSSESSTVGWCWCCGGLSVSCRASFSVRG